MERSQPTKTGVLDLLRNSVGTQYVIPVYQRNYTWTAKNEVKQLLHDLKAVLNNEYNKHFIGMIIYLENPISPFKRECSIIDGQQRLTTIFLLLYVIKNILKQNKHIAEAEQLDKVYLTNYMNDDIKYKLKPLVSDDEVYVQIVNDNFHSITAKNSNVYLNYQYLKREIIELNNNFSIDAIMDALNKLYLVCIPITNDDYPQKIFESINATGAKLTASDLIRNYVLMPIDSDKQERFYSKYWRPIEELVSIESKKLEAFFRYFIMAKTRSLVNKSAVYKAFTKWFESQIENNIAIEDILTDISSYAEHYHYIYELDIKKVDNTIKDALDEFRDILSEMPAVLLLELFAIHYKLDTNGNNLISWNQLSEIILVLNSYLQRRALCGYDTSDLTAYFPSLLKGILDECNGCYDNIVEIFKKHVVNLSRGSSAEMPTDSDIRNRLDNSNMYSIRASVKIFFKKLENENNNVHIDFNKLNIEHLMPQNPTKTWLDSLQVDEETYQKNLHRLGNLTLTSCKDNSKMGNKPWEYKNKILAETSHIKMNVPLINKEQWTIQDIEDRTKELIEDVIRLYPYYTSALPIIDYGNSIPIYPTSKDISGLGYFFFDGNVTITKGTTLRRENIDVNLYPKIAKYINELISNNIIGYKDNKLQFLEDYTFRPLGKETALSTTASLLTGGSRNGYDWWLLKNGKPISQILDFLDKMNNLKP